MRINGVIAHFDPSGERSSNFRTLLRILRSHLQDAVVVSTGISPDDADVAAEMGYALVRRGNVGYDFMSYAVGYDTIRGARQAEKILFCNDSFYISDEGKFTEVIKKIVHSDYPATFLSSSTQIVRHGQSYLFAVDHTVFDQPLFRQFMNSVRPQPSRLHVIYAYELGLASCLKNVNADFEAIIDSRRLTPASRNVRKRGINPTHDYADEIEEQCGIVKYERLLRNPLLLDVSPRLAEIARLAASNSSQSNLRAEQSKPLLVVVCHCHYEEVVEELVSVLDRLPDGSRIQVTSSNPSVLAAFKTRWRRRNVELDVLATENKGRDVLPFLEALRALNLGDDIPVLKIHGKRSLYSPLGEQWRRDLLDELIPSEAGIREIVTQFTDSPRLAMIGARGSYVSNQEYWGSNEKRVSRYMVLAGAPPPNSGDLGFYAGTMFWIRSQCANEMLSHVEFERFEAEQGQRDGTYGHVLERAIPMTLRAQGWALLETRDGTPLSPANIRSRRLTYF